uniref:DUF19 domain-containing protein n=1 Tax=Caenorhabditis tropicalis TaxID=1561998 RepID=A0A1I7TQQ0_9PELO
MNGFHFLLLVVTTCVNGAKNTISFPDSLYPTDLSLSQFRQKCPLYYGKLEFCKTTYEDCFGLLRSPNDCEKEFFGCIRVDSDDINCRKYIDEARLIIRYHGRAFQRRIIEKRMKPAVDKINKRLKPIKEKYIKLIENCGVESEVEQESNRMLSQINSTNSIFDPTMMLFAMYKVESSMNKTEICQKSIEEFQNELGNVDSKTAESLKVPYHFWFIGIEFGAIGRVITRIVADEVCGIISFDFNQHKAVHLDCYDQQRDQEECDSVYNDSLNYSLKTTDSKKLNCKMFVDLLEAIQIIRGNDFYKEASEHFIESSKTSIDGEFRLGFEEFFNGSMTGRDTRNAFLRLEVSEKSTRRISLLFDDISSKCGSSKNTLASCGFKYEYCIHLIKSECQTKFSACLTDIHANNEQCRGAIQKMTDLLYPSIYISKEISKRQSNENNVYVEIAVLAAFIGFCVLIGFIIYRYRPMKEISDEQKPNANCDSSSKNTELKPLNQNEEIQKFVERTNTESGTNVSSVSGSFLNDNNANYRDIPHESSSNNHNNSEDQENQNMKSDESDTDSAIFRGTEVSQLL